MWTIGRIFLKNSAYPTSSSSLRPSGWGKILDLHEGYRTSVRLFGRSQRKRTVCLLRACGGMSHHGPRKRRQALRNEYPLLPPAPGLRNSAPGRRMLGRGSRARPFLSGSGIRRIGERFHQPRHHVHDLDSHYDANESGTGIMVLMTI